MSTLHLPSMPARRVAGPAVDADRHDAEFDRSAAAAPTVAAIRLALVAAIALGAIIDDRRSQYDPVFYLVLAIGGGFATATLLVPARRRPLLYLYAGLDLVLLATLAHSSGGASSEVRFAFFAIPLLAAMLFRPRPTLITSAGVLTVYLTLALSQHQPDAVARRQLVYVELVYLAWTVVAAVSLSWVLTRRADTIARLARARAHLMADVLHAEDRERRRLASWLHDGPVQNLLVAGQDLGEAEDGDLAGLHRARTILRETIPQLRSALVDLHPGLLQSTGLGPALRALAQAQARHGAFRVAVSVDDGAEELHDQLLLSLARELLINVVKHAHAEEVQVAVRRTPASVVLEVADDGRGFDLACCADAVAAGHIGLASSAERIESVGGRLEVDSAPGLGTRVLMVLPVPARGW